MKVMIAYDGSRHADAILENLPNAGLPRSLDALIVSVANRKDIKPVVSKFDLFSLPPWEADALALRVEKGRHRLIEEIRATASEAAKRLLRRFPNWKVNIEVLDGDPAAELLRQAAMWKPDLIVVGSSGDSAIRKFFRGSVSKKVAENAVCPVQVLRHQSRLNQIFNLAALSEKIREQAKIDGNL